MFNLLLQRSKKVILGGLVWVVMRNEDDGGGRVGRTRGNFGKQRENLREKGVGTLWLFGGVNEKSHVMVGGGI